MFYERVSAGGTSGRTVSQMLERYGFPPRRPDLLKAILTLPQNVPLMQASGGKIELDTDLTRFAGQMRGGASLCLPIDFQAAHKGKPVVRPYRAAEPSGQRRQRPLAAPTHSVPYRSSRSALTKRSSAYEVGSATSIGSSWTSPPARAIR